jgi:formylglycine-generating enzyme required for sulfatase activity
MNPQATLCPVPGGRFSMGSDRHHAEEAPAHPAEVAPWARVLV